MSGQPFHLRYVKEITGTFVVLAALIALLGLFLMAGAQRWFAPVEKITVMLPADGSHGLREDAEVQILGAVAGKVRRISIGTDGRMKARVHLDPDFLPFVRSDSRAIIRRKLALVPAVYLELTRGSGPPLPAKHPRLQAEAEKDLKTVATEILTQVEQATLPTFREYAQLAAELRDPQGPLQQLLQRLTRIAADLESGEGALPRLLRDPALAGELEGTLVGANATLGDLRRTLRSAEATSGKLAMMTDNVNRQLESLPQLLALTGEVLRDTRQVMEGLRQATDRLPEISRGIGREVDALPGLLLQATLTLEEIETLVLALQKHWLVRGYVEPAAPPGRIPPQRIPAAEGAP
ncbi:hypothetical protein DESUT3_09120 [Desulfuromonas versatilis]|uniref:Mce/MlaD domain-containing protein n=1 Tax=Desulfuromonas versatilis TaxID=2802975 RepID=A0ABN6DUP7_9BACT|nr:MlaD family protein [Desulfuromonas versatilis]BCR03843.1 hypothetical protein DESUT3_09120 [Desulfuromonas versatilis]